MFTVQRHPAAGIGWRRGASASQMATTPNYEQFVSTAKQQVEKSTSQFLKGIEEMTALTKQNVDAFVKSGTILAKGFETISKSNAAYAQSTLESPDCPPSIRP